MKRKDIKFYILGVLTLLLISCSLVNPIPIDKVMQSSIAHSKSRDLTSSVRDQDVIYCTVETGYQAGRVNFRAGAGLTFEVLAVLSEGTRLEVLNVDDWMNVRTTDNVVGYIKSKYCRIGE